MLCHGRDLIRLCDYKEDIRFVNWSTTVKPVGSNNDAICRSDGGSERFVVSKRFVVGHSSQAGFPFEADDHS
jgi:hypothetical protein